jgi:zinc and cadmium transporter
MSALLITGWTCVMTLGGGLLALRLHAYRAFVLAFAAGALVATALIDMIPEGLDLLMRSADARIGFSESFSHHQVMLASCFGFLAFYLLEKGAHDDPRHGNADHVHTGTHRASGLWGAMGIGIHSLLDGVAIGEAFHAGSGLGWVVALAVVVHKFADGVSTVGVLVTTGRRGRTANAILALVALAPLAGLVIQFFVPVPLSVLALVLGWFAGVFLYLGAAALMPAAHDVNHSRWLPAATFAGVTLVYLISRASSGV